LSFGDGGRGTPVRLVLRGSHDRWMDLPSARRSSAPWRPASGREAPTIPRTGAAPSTASGQTAAATG